MVKEPGRELRIKAEFDVIVCGGGPAGIAAAIAAARRGARTFLIEANGSLGGIWTSGLLSYILDGDDKDGIMREIFDRLGRLQARSGIVCDVETMKLVVEEMCIEAGVVVRLYTRVSAAYCDGQGRLYGIVTDSKSGKEAWGAGIFIDTTGDGDLAAQAGAGFDYGQEETGVTQPMSLIALVRAGPPETYKEFAVNNGRSVRLYPEIVRGGYNPTYAKAGMSHIRDQLYIMMANHQYGLSGLDADHLTRASMDSRQDLYRISEALRSLGGIWQDFRIVATAAAIGVREGRRIKGRYTVTIDDMLQGRRHEDAVCRVTFKVDVHSPNPQDSKGMAAYNDMYRNEVKPYDVPLRALIARDVDGLLMAGRCISGDFLAHSSYRVTGNAVPMGEAAGALAAAAVRMGVLPQYVPWQEVSDVLLPST
jgi:hypothetical protein